MTVVLHFRFRVWKSCGSARKMQKVTQSTWRGGFSFHRRERKLVSLYF